MTKPKKEIKPGRGWGQDIHPFTFRDLPIGSKAFAFNGGHWFKTKLGWKWNGPNGSGGIFPSPGGDWLGDISVPTRDYRRLLADAKAYRDGKK